MSNYRASISRNGEGSFFALVVRIESDGQAVVVNDYQGRHFKTQSAALRSTTKYIAKTNLIGAVQL